jgi:hypothetical protein
MICKSFIPCKLMFCLLSEAKRRALRSGLLMTGRSTAILPVDSEHGRDARATSKAANLTLSRFVGCPPNGLALDHVAE